MHRITETRTTPGRSKDQEAYQSDISGIYHIIHIVEDIFSKQNIRDGSITILQRGVWSLFTDSPTEPESRK